MHVLCTYILYLHKYCQEYIMYSRYYTSKSGIAGYFHGVLISWLLWFEKFHTQKLKILYSYTFLN